MPLQPLPAPSPPNYPTCALLQPPVQAAVLRLVEVITVAPVALLLEQHRAQGLGSGQAARLLLGLQPRPHLLRQLLDALPARLLSGICTQGTRREL
jgi:hypothetical protein